MATTQKKAEDSASKASEAPAESKKDDAKTAAPKKEFVVVYTGTSEVRRVESQDFAANGITQNTLEWNPANGHRIPVEGLPKDVLTFLTEKVGDLKVVEA